MPAKNAKSDFSGHLHLRMPSHLHKSLAERAAKQEVSLNTLIVAVLSRSARR